MNVTFEKRVLELAALSCCTKRKVGALIVLKDKIIAEGINGFDHITSKPCEDVLGLTHPDVKHAEIIAISIAKAKGYSLLDLAGATMYISHQPCDNCKQAMRDVGITDMIVPTKAIGENKLTSTLLVRNSSHGDFNTSSITVQALKDTMRHSRNWEILTGGQKEALEMVAHKLGRILYGDPNFIDSWHDIAGYTTIIEKYLTKKEENKNENS